MFKGYVNCSVVVQYLVMPHVRHVYVLLPLVRPHVRHVCATASVKASYKACAFGPTYSSKLEC